MGGDKGVHVVDEAIHGSDSLATSLVLAKALEHLGFDLVLAGMSSTDAEMSVVPSMVAERLDVNQATFAGALSVAGGTVTITREGDTATEQVSTELPAVVSITDQTDEARYPAFRAIMLAKKKPVETLSLADIGVDPARVGLAAAATRVARRVPGARPHGRHRRRRRRHRRGPARRLPRLPRRPVTGARSVPAPSRPRATTSAPAPAHR